MFQNLIKKSIKWVILGIVIFLTLGGLVQKFPEITSVNLGLLSATESTESVDVRYEPDSRKPVDESAVRQVLYVNPTHSKASDSNDGRENTPLKTLTQANTIVQDNYQNKTGTKVIIYPGVYRESIRLTSEDKKIQVPVIFEAKKAGSVIISGAEVWSDWEPHPNSPLYTHHWPYLWGVAENSWPDQIEVAPIVRRREMVFINGKLLAQKLSRNELTEGTFYVSENENKIYIYPEFNTNVKKSTIEVATKDTLFLTENVNNVVIRGLVFKHAASSFREAAVSLRYGVNFLVENSQFIWNNWEGLNIRIGDNVIVKNVIANYNGQRGVGGFRLRNALYEDIETSYNNWRGAWGQFYEFDAGHKFFGLRNTTFRRYRAVGNMASGLWLDYDNQRVWIDESYFCNNLEVGLYIEASQHILVTNSVICNNRATPKSLYPHPGVLGATSSHVTLENNIICGNERSQIKVYVRTPREVINWETEEKYLLISDHWVLKNNTIIGKDASQLLIYIQPNGTGFIDTLVSDKNTWYNSKNNLAFQINETTQFWGKRDFAGWQAFSGQDKNSVFATPSANFNCGQSL